MTNYKFIKPDYFYLELFINKYVSIVQSYKIYTF